MLLLSAAIGEGTEIGTTVALQARYLLERGYSVKIGAPYPALFDDAVPGLHVPLDNGRDAAAYAVAWGADNIVVHTANFGDTSRWLGADPPVLLHYHGEQAEVVSGVGGHTQQKEARLLALPFVAQVLAVSAEAREELLLPTAAIHPPGADRVGLWSGQLRPLREETRRKRGWSDKIVILVASALGGIDDRFRREIETLIPEFDERTVIFALLVTDTRRAIDLPRGMTTVAPATIDELQGLLVGADIYWPWEGRRWSLDALEAAALGLTIFAPPATRSRPAAKAIARALKDAAEAGGVPDPWSRRAPSHPGWGEALDEFDAILAGLRGFPRKRSSHAGAMLSPEALILESGLFDPEYYYACNADVVGHDAIQHFLANGLQERRPFSRLFDVAWYLDRYPDAHSNADGPLLDYLSHPRGLRDPNRYFSNEAYLEALGDDDAGGLTPLVHYLRSGAEAGLSFGDAFDGAYYTSVYPDVASSGENPLVHFLTVGRSEGRLPKRPDLVQVDLFDDEGLSRATGRGIEQVVPQPTDADEINGRNSAARFCLTLLRSRSDLRRRYPRALSAGSDGPFARWLQDDGATELGLPVKARGHIADLFAGDPAARVRQVRFTQADVATAHPMALLPIGAGDFLKWALSEGINERGFSREDVWWFLLSAAESSARGIIDTYLFTPVWQRLFPDGITVFGRPALAAWLKASFDISPDWIALDGSPEPLDPAEQIRIAYNARSEWQEQHPAPFASAAAASRLLAWLADQAAGLTEDAAIWLAGQDKAALAEALAQPGLNMLGHFCYASGLRTSAESLVEGFRLNGGAVALRDVWVQERGDDARHTDYAGLEAYDVTIVHTQPEPLFDVAFERAGLAPRTPRTYRIGYWYWELETIPPHWQKQADELDEIWTATTFVGDALKERFDLPVRVIMPGLEHPVFEPLPRSRFGLPKGTFLFLFTFHMASIMERKNPLGLIAAFIEAFGKDDTVGLVLKTSFGHMYPDQLTELRDAAEGYNIVIIDDVYTKEEILALMDTCDSYVSLHRSEGYGLTMAEAMLLGKPVIATAYSGNLEFMSNETSLLVKYDLVTLDRDYPPYKAGMRWAHASTRHAAECMRKIRENPEWARELGAKAKADLAIRMSLEASGRKMHDRISQIMASIKGASSSS